MKKLLDYLPSLHDVYIGIFLIMLGILMLNGGGFAVQISPESVPHWIVFPTVNSVACWLIIWLGIDSTVTGSKITAFVLSGVLKPLLSGVVKSIRGEKLDTQNEDEKE